MTGAALSAKGARCSALAAPAAAVVSLLFSSAGYAIVRPDHVVVVIEEDRGANAIGDPNMPYFNQLASTGLLYGNSRGIGRPSQLNYLVLFSGSTHGVEDNFPGYTYFAEDNNLAKSLNSTPGLSFVGYAESLPAAGSQAQYAPDPSVDPDAHPDLYFRGYNPMAQFTAVGPGRTNADINQPFSSFPSDFNLLPTVSFVTPDAFHNTHGSNEAPYTDASSDYDALRRNADSWLHSNLDGYLDWARTHNSLLIVTGDEEDEKHHPENGITTIVNGDPRLFVPGVNLNQIDHYQTLRTLLDMYGLAPIGLTGNVSAFDTNASGQLYAPPSNGTWIATATGATWGNIQNWSSGLPNAAGATANFDAGTNLQHAVTIDGVRTVGVLNFNDTSKYTLDGTGSILIDSPSGIGAINVLNGSHDILATISLNQNTVVDVASGSTLSLSKLNDGTVNINKQGGGALALNRLRTSAVTIDAGTVAIVGARSEDRTNRIGTLSIAGGSTPTATLDLGANDLILDYTGDSPLETIAAQIRSAYASGSWNGSGITTSVASLGDHPTGLGYAEAGALSVGSFSDQSIDTTTVLIRYTLLGDSNLDGTVDTADFTALADHFGNTSAMWSDGDANYDGVVNALDFNAIADNFGQLLPGDMPGKVVPEPDFFAAYVLAMLALSTRRLRRAAA